MVTATAATELGADDNWLGSYINSTEYGSNAKINSNPVKSQPKQDGKPEKKFYFLQTKIVASSAAARRKSMSAVDSTRREGVLSGSAALTSTVVPVVESLPERVNAIREQEKHAGHFIREHRKSHEKEDYDLSSTQGLTSGSTRRRSLDFDELEAVKERVSQVTDLWQKEKARARESLDTVTSEDGDVITLSHFQIDKSTTFISEPKEEYQSFPKSGMGNFFKGKQKGRGFFAKLFRR